MFSRTGAATNLLLSYHGFIEGGPGAWRPTELGKQFAQSHDFDNGYGGFAHRQWGWLSWTAGLGEALRASMGANPGAWNERVKPAASQVRARIAERRSAAGTAGATGDDAEE